MTRNSAAFNQETNAFKNEPIEINEKYLHIEKDKETENENRDRARSLGFVKREEALRNAGQIQFHGSLQFAHEKPRPDSTVGS